MDYIKIRQSLEQGLTAIKNKIRQHEETLDTLRTQMHQQEGALLLIDSLGSQAKEEKDDQETSPLDNSLFIASNCRMPNDTACACKSDPAGCHVAAIEGNDKSIRPFRPE